MYFPAKEVPSRQFFQADDMQLVKLKTADGVELTSWFKPAETNHPTVLFLHGNAGNIGYRMPLVRQFLARGFGVLLLEYRGYGGNHGQPTESGLYQDGLAGLQFLEAQHIPSSRIVLYGESLGTSVATYLATKTSSCAVILQSPFTSMTAVARYHYPWIFISPWDKFDSLSRIDEIKSPLLIVHGEKDTIVPYTQGQMVFEKANEPKQMLSIPNRGHNDLWDNNFVATVTDFIAAHCF